MNFLGSSKSLLLIYRNMGQQKLTESVNLLLTPQFYTLKKKSLPLKYAFQVKKIAPSLFDGLLENIEAYEYLVYKEDDKWVFIAYNPKEISHFLQSKGINVQQVGKVFFAEQALASFSFPVMVGEKNVMTVVNGAVVMVPKSAVKEESIILDDSFTPKGGISLEGAFNTLITQKQAIILATVFLFFALAFTVEGWRYAAVSNETRHEIESLLEEYPTLQSQYSRQSITKKYRKIDSSERRKREIVKTLAGMLFKGVKVEYFKMNEKGFQIRFSCTNAKVARRLKELAKKLGFSSAKTLTGNIVLLEEKL